MSSPQPENGLVIRYDFLWKEEDRAGQEHGLKDRPCAVVLVGKAREGGRREVVVCPITHSPPGDKAGAIEIPDKVGRHLKLDEDRSWIITNEINTFDWTEGLIPFGMTQAAKGRWSFGVMPPRLYAQMRDRILAHSRDRSLGIVKRDAPK